MLGDMFAVLVQSGKLIIIKHMKCYAIAHIKQQTLLLIYGFTAILNFSRFFGGHNYYTLGFLSSWPASLAAILIERPSRRGALAIYVCYVVC